jgi:ABC-type uncharacterized transport system permease subunit
VGLRIATDGTIEFFTVDGAERSARSACWCKGGRRLRAGRRILEHTRFAGAGNDGRACLPVAHAYETRYDGGVENKRSGVALSVCGKEPVLELREGKIRTRLSETEDGLLLAAVDTGGLIGVVSATLQQNLLSGESALEPATSKPGWISRQRQSQSAEPPVVISWALTAVRRLALPGMEIVETVALEEAHCDHVHAVGGISVLAGDEAGTISQLFRCAMIKRLLAEIDPAVQGGTSAIRKILPEQRRKGFLRWMTRVAPHLPQHSVGWSIQNRWPGSSLPPWRFPRALMAC